MAEYQIRELAHLTGIKAPTIRVWEQRYGLLQPKRTQTNIRYYDDDDLCALLNVALLTDNGYRISRIALMSPTQRAQEVETIACRPHPGESVVLQQLIQATISLDELTFARSLQSAIDADGLENTMLRIVYPFLERIGILWHTGTINPAQEHLITNLIRQKTIVALDQLGLQPSDGYAPTARRFVLYLPETELHELALLLMHYVLRVRGHRVVYLGQNLPTRDLQEVCDKVRPDYLLTVLTVVPERDKVAAYIAAVAAQHAPVGLLLYGLQVQHPELVLPLTARAFGQMNQFIGWVDQLGQE